LATDVEQSVDEDVLAAAAWLHDIGRPLERTDEVDDHDKWATQEVVGLLKPEGLSKSEIEAIQHCIRTHSIRASSPSPESIEAKLLFDADKLDATGAVGIARLVCIVGERSGQSGERYAVIDDLTASREATSDQRDVALLQDWAKERLNELYTEPAQELGKTRWKYMERFFEQFHTEIEPTGTQ
jgi:uncharacterized protein